MALAFTQTAPAQTPASLVVIAGTGQVTCPGCSTAGAMVRFQFLLPLVVQVLDGNGQPLANKTVNWTLISSQGPIPNFGAQTSTDGNGVTANFFQQPNQPGSFAQEYLQSVVQASADGASVN